ncbi:tripartite motif-containing protein 16-like [Pholidichthys leucotaenia]
MAQQGSQLYSDKFSCSICLDLLRDPVAIPCGHSYCMGCIKIHWDEEDKKESYSCPQCRKTFIPRPDLVKNIMLSELVEELKKTELQAAPADLCYAEPQDVACDICAGRKLKAVKSCLDCRASYCDTHLQPHYDAAPFKKHKLVDPSKNFQDSICSRHDEVMKIFCRTDQQSVCYLCTMDQHKGHETVPTATERMEKQKALEANRLKILQRIQDRETDVKVLQQEVEAINWSADKAVEDGETIFTKLICLIQKRLSDVKEQVRSQQEHEVSRVKGLQENLEQEIADLKRKDAELEQLSRTEDHMQFLKDYSSVSALSESIHSTSVKSQPLRYFEAMTAAVLEVSDKLQDILTENWTNISLKETEVEFILQHPEPTTRDEFLEYSREITLDPNTAHKRLQLSEGNRKVAKIRRYQSYSNHPDRFTHWFQVLSKESLSGRCYWEVEWRGSEVEIAVAYKSISRAGDEDDVQFGMNDDSWSLRCFSNSFEFWHDEDKTEISVLHPSRVGVYLDHNAGTLSFYGVCEIMTLLHRVKTKFKKPLYAGVLLSGQRVSAEFIKLN